MTSQIPIYVTQLADALQIKHLHTLIFLPTWKNGVYLSDLTTTEGKMMSNFKKYDNYSYREIWWRLHQSGLPEPVINQTIVAIKAFRAERANLKRQKKELDLQWSELIFPLQHERKIIRAMRRYKTNEPTPERDEFLEAYALALDKVLQRLKGIRQETQMLPTYEHWTDYVPPKIKAALRQAAGNIPPKHKSKFKEPFTRTTPSQLNDKRRARVVRKAQTELDSVQTQLQLDPNNEALQKRERLIRRGIYIVKHLPPTQAVPNTWHSAVALLEHGDGEDE